MKNHESGCTMNPGRVCRMCRASGIEQKPMADLIEAAKRDYETWEAAFNLDDDACRAAVMRTIPKELIDACEGCPACVLAAIRQGGHLGYFDFDYAAECKSRWADINDEKASIEYERERHTYYG
jgi:hypothetical protein